MILFFDAGSYSGSAGLLKSSRKIGARTRIMSFLQAFMDDCRHFGVKKMGKYTTNTKKAVEIPQAPAFLPVLGLGMRKHSAESL